LLSGTLPGEGHYPAMNDILFSGNSLCYIFCLPVYRQYLN
jgi:hypothetical protein